MLIACDLHSEEYKGTIIDHPKYFFQKHVESESVCELNNKLFINVEISHFEIANNLHEYINVEIRAEKYGKWWILACYSLKFIELEKNIFEIENRLIKIFNAL